MSTLDALLAAIVADPCEETRWLVLADWLQENDQPDRAELLGLHRKMIATCLEPDAHPERAGWQARMVELLVAGVRPCVPQETLTLPGGVSMTFSFIPPGSFLMGSENGNSDERPVRLVAVDRALFLGTASVTQAQWAAVMGTDPS
ncbi:MAG TPA: TIGR02996 domain-containing protein, partial [Gemmata sp.]